MASDTSNFEVARRRIALVGSIIALLAVIQYLDWSLLARIAAKLSPVSIAACIIANVFVFLCMALRWAVIVASDGQPFRRHEVLIALHAYAFNLITPAAVGADVFRLADTRGRVGGRLRTASLLLAERCLGCIAQCACFIFAWFAFHLNLGLTVVNANVLGQSLFDISALFFLGLGVASLTALLGAAPFALRFLPDRGWLAETLRALIEAVRGASALHWPLLSVLSFAAAAGWVAGGWALAVGLGLQLPIHTVAMIVIITEFARLVPISIQGIGVREATFAWLTTSAGAMAEIGFVVCASLYIINNIVLALLGLFAGIKLGALNEKSQGEEQ